MHRLPKRPFQHLVRPAELVHMVHRESVVANVGAVHPVNIAVGPAENISLLVFRAWVMPHRFPVLVVLKKAGWGQGSTFCCRQAQPSRSSAVLARSD